MMKRILATAIFLMSLCEARAASLTNFIGTWRLDKIVGVQDVTGPGDGKLELGHDIVLSANAISAPGGVDCERSAPKYSVKETAALLTNDWGVPQNYLHLGKYYLPSTVGVIESFCSNSIVLAQDKLLVNLGNGYFYIASRRK